jgi:hypothetical protein
MNSERLYVADTGNNRIGVLDVADATERSSFRGFETMVSEMSGAQWSTVIHGNEFDLVARSGLALGDGVLFVGDNATSTVHAFSPEGDLLESLELDIEEGGLMGLRVGPDGHSLWVTDFIGHQVLRIEGVGERNGVEALARDRPPRHPTSRPTRQPAAHPATRAMARQRLFFLCSLLGADLEAEAHLGGALGLRPFVDEGTVVGGATTWGVIGLHDGVFAQTCEEALGSVPVDVVRQRHGDGGNDGNDNDNDGNDDVDIPAPTGSCAHTSMQSVTSLAGALGIVWPFATRRRRRRR